ncbi:serine O-acetyltransferase [Biformimicrobium ophioploci]|uniref:Serine acetyltransferase n=1 Tax=Biformimicrobium ophioploci TaxID=3036711 RepID=A0ABQ6LWJ1_9GAMM|nr:serine O-acetyltransferase [Microbulbifer sp. NKW57]GMG86438.1 serine O-acetyltransferase [Microbulbifer sp. NKW57]
MNDQLWQAMREEAQAAAQSEPVLASYFHNTVLRHASLAAALAYQLASVLDHTALPATTLKEVIAEALAADPQIGEAMQRDICAWYERDPACDAHILPFLNFKGFHALQSHRIAHWLWQQGRQTLAYYFQSRVSEQFAVDIHPAARFGAGIMIDHATGLVVGETAVVGDDVSILHSVTLGGTGSGGGDRHPKIGNCVMIGAGAKVLGPIHVGECVKVAAGSLVLEDVPAHSTVAGVPARVVGQAAEAQPALTMDQSLGDET